MRGVLIRGVRIREITFILSGGVRAGLAIKFRERVMGVLSGGVGEEIYK